MSETYRATRLERFAANFREATAIVALPIEAPGPGQVRVRNRCCRINGTFGTQFALGKARYMRMK